MSPFFSICFYLRGHPHSTSGWGQPQGSPGLGGTVCILNIKCMYRRFCLGGAEAASTRAGCNVGYMCERTSAHGRSTDFPHWLRR